MSEVTSKSSRGTYLINDLNDTVPQYSLPDWIGSLPNGTEGSPERLFKDDLNASMTGLNNQLADYSKTKPIVLLPIRVESKFIGTDLWLRFFPDQIFIKSLEKALTSEELTDGQDYWQKYVDANGVLSKQKEAWRFLCSKYGVTRAAWIIRSLFPTNLISQSNNPNLLVALGKLDDLGKDIITGSSNYVSPNAVIEFIRTTNESISGLNKQFESGFGISTIEESFLKSVSDFAQRMIQSKYDAIINPFLAEDNTLRSDETLIEPWSLVQASLRVYRSKISYNKLDFPLRAKLQVLMNSHKTVALGKRAVGEYDELLKETKNKLSELLPICNASQLGNDNWIRILNEIYLLRSIMQETYDRLNPYINSAIPSNGRENPSLEPYFDYAWNETENFISSYVLSFPDIGAAIAECLAIEERINLFTNDSTNTNAIRQFFRSITNELNDAGSNYDKRSISAVDEVASLYDVLCALSKSMDQKYDDLINPFVDPSKVLSGRKNESFEILKEAFDADLMVFKARLSALCKSSSLNQSLIDIAAWRKELRNPKILNDASSTIKKLDLFIQGLEKQLPLNQKEKLDQFILMKEVQNLFEEYIVVYESELNPLQIKDRPSEGGQDKGLNNANDLLFNSYNQYLTALLGKGSTIDGFVSILLVHKDVMGFNLEYTRPSKVIEDFTALQRSSIQLRDSLIGLPLNPMEREVLFAATEALSKDFNDRLETVYNPSLDALDESKGTLNPQFNASADSLLTIWSDIQASKGTVDPSLSNENFSYQFNGPLVFPTVEIKNGNWTVQEYSDILPTRFVAIGLDESDDNLNAQDNIKFIHFGSEVDHTVKFGFNPANASNDTDFDIQGNDNDDGNTELSYGPALSWIFDKSIAKEKGLAMQIPVGSTTYFSRIIVVGIIETVTDVAQHENRLKELILDHQFTKGISLLNVGAPTNNTAEVASEYNREDSLFDEGFATFAQDKLFQPTSNKNTITDGQLFAEFLGLPYSSAYHIAGAQNQSITRGHIGSRVLFPGTIGLHMEEVLDNLLNADNRKRIRKFFEEYVSARGLAPSLRIGKQPYGLLITSNLHNYLVRNESAFRTIDDFLSLTDPSNPDNLEYPVQSKLLLVDNPHINVQVNEVKTSVFTETEWQIRFLKRLKQVLIFLDKEWRKVAQSQAKNTYLDNIEFHRAKLEQTIQTWENSQDDPNFTSEQQSYLNDYAQNHLMSVIGHLPYSYDLSSRYVINSGSWHNVSSIEGLGDLFGGLDLAQGIEVPASNPAWYHRMSARINSAAVPNGYSTLEHFMKFDLEKGIYTGFDYSTWNGPSKSQISAFVNEELTNKIKFTRAFITTNAAESLALEGALVSKDASDIANGPNGYLKWILNNANFNLLFDNDFSSLPSKSILFLLARASYLAKHRELAMRMLVQEGLANWSQLMALGTAENALNSYIKIAHYDNLGYVSFGSSSSNQTFVKENAWKFTKWNILMSKYYERTPYLIGARDAYALIEDNVTNMRTLNTGDIIDIQMSWLESETNINYPWKKSNLLRYLSPNVSQEWGIFEVSDSAPNLKTIADYLMDPSSADGIYSNYTIKSEITKYKADLEFLSELSVSELEQITSECIDLSANRLDAWIHGLFNLRLKQLRNRFSSVNINSPGVNFSKGSYVGAYGYIENLRRRSSGQMEGPQLTAIDHEDLPVELSSCIPSNASVYTDNGSYGFLPTPSLTHAVTAAILNSTYQTYKVHEETQVYNRSAVNLSSARIRAALFLLQGVQAGNDLGNLLGQQFENGLHEASTSGNVNLDLTIHRLRKIYPCRSIAGSQIETGPDSSLVPISGEVLNGIAILDKIKVIYDDALLPNQSLYESLLNNLNGLYSLNAPLPDDTQVSPPVYEALQGLSNDELKIIAFHIDQMAQSLDALGDLVITESVYQIANGNHARATAAIGMMDGSSGLLEPEVIQSPLMANQFTNRILMNYPVVPELQSELSDDDLIQDAWSSGSIPYCSSPRAGLDQGLNNWLSKLALDPNQIIITVAVSNSADQEETHMHISLAQVALQPLDWVALINVESTRPTAELTKVILFYFRKTMNFDENVTCRLVFDSFECPNGVLSFQEFYPLVGQWKEMLMASRPIVSHDFSEKASEDGDLGYVVTDWKNRINSLINYASDLLVELNAIVAFDTALADDNEISDWIACLEKCVKMGMVGVVPATSVLPIEQEHLDAFKLKIKALCEVAQTLLSDRIAKSTNAVAAWSSIQSNEHASLFASASSICEMLMGGKTYMHPLIRFDVDQVNDSNPLADAIAYSGQLTPPNEPGHLQRWLHANGMVRRNVSSLLNLQVSYEIMRNIEPLDDIEECLQLKPVQIPHEVGATWLGMDNQSGSNIHGKCNLLVNALSAITIEAITTPQPLHRFTACGFKLDDWNEAIPMQEITAGIAAHINQPDAEAPQTILMVVPNSEEPTWSWNLNDVVMGITQAFDMAKCRAVEAEHLGQPNEEGQESLLAKIFPANMVDIFPTQEAGNNATAPHDYGGIRPTFNYGENNN